MPFGRVLSSPPRDLLWRATARLRRPLVALGLPNPVVKRLRRAADLRRDRNNRCPLRGVIASVLDHHPHGPCTHFR
jgi:hypothetical protein